MLDNRGEETEYTKGDKTQSENQRGVHVLGASVQSSFCQNVPEFSDAKPEPDQREAGADPGHEGSVSSLAGALFSEFVGDILAGRVFAHGFLQSFLQKLGPGIWEFLHKAVLRGSCRL